MPEKKFNHIIPKCLLKHWNVEGDDYIGVHAYKINEKKFEFSSANGKKAFSFAGSNDFYVPKLNKKRYLGIENFFSEGENILTKVINRITTNKKEDFLKDRSTFDKFLKALISLKFRTKWHLTNFANHIKNENIQRDLLDKDLIKDIDLLVLEGMINTSATARKLAVIIWNMVIKKQPYANEHDYEFLDQKRKRKVKEMKKLNHKFDIKTNELGLAYQ